MVCSSVTNLDGATFGLPFFLGFEGDEGWERL